MVGIPPERAISYAPVVKTWMTQIAQQGWPQIGLDYHRTDVARHVCAWHLLDDTDCTHLVMLDIDHDHESHVVAKLCDCVSEDPENRQVVSALCFRRGQPYEPIAYRLDADGILGPVLEWQEGELIEVDSLGFGAVIIAREVFERLPLPWFAYDYTYVENRHFPSEDSWFSRQCKENGIRMWVDTRIRAPHLTIAFVNEDTYRGYVALEKSLIKLAEGEEWQE